MSSSAIPTGMRLDADWGASWRTLLGEAVALDFDPQGRLWILHRPGFSWDDLHRAIPLVEPCVLVVAPASGELLYRWGAGRFACPHGLKWAPDGNLWIVDSGLHQVFQFDSDLEPGLVLGHRGLPGDTLERFNFPTDIAFLSGGRLAVSDGYGNNRIVRFSAAGEPLGCSGTNGDGPGQLNLPHAVCVDGDERLLVVDRGNARIQRFDANGRFLDMWRGDALGHPWALRRSGCGWFYGVDAGDTLVDEERSGAFILDEDGRLLLRWGNYGRDPGAFIWPHDIAAAADAVYVAEARGCRVQRFLPEFSDEPSGRTSPTGDSRTSDRQGGFPDPRSDCP